MARMTRGVGTTLALLLAFLACALARAGEPAGVPRGAQRVANAQRDASARFVHRIELKDADGNVIGPKRLVPYSPRQTCGTARCHDYNTISQGSHTIMFADPEPDPKRPPVHIWTVFDEQTGTQHPLSHGWLPSEKRPCNAKVHKTPFTLARELGAYHPGGGRYEHDREGQRYDKALAANLALRDDATSPDYAGSRWDQSGVLEIDCLVCHSRDRYDHVERGTQISVLNFKWAPTVGAGFGTVEGKTIILPKSEAGAEPPSGAEPAVKVHYKPGICDEHGKVEINVGRPPDRNCLFCHRKPAREQTSWHDALDADVHTRSGLACVDCHHATISHAIFGSRRHAEFLADDPDFQTLSCKGCHSSGRLGSPVPEHPGLPQFHLKMLACEACHSGPRLRRIPLAIEKPTNYLWGTPGGATTGSGPTVWAPVFVKDDTGQIRPVMRMLPAFYGRKVEGSFQPLAVSRVKSRIRKLAGLIEKARKLQEDLKAATDEEAKRKLIEREKKSRAKVGITDEEIKQLADDDDGTGVVNTDVEIAVLLKLLTKKSDKPERNYEPLYFVGGIVYSLDNADEDPNKWTLNKEPSPLADPIDLPLAHNVRPAAQALGAQGCLECHHYASPFWHSVGITRAVGADGQPEGAPLHARVGMSAPLRVLGDLGARFVQPYARWAILLIVLAMALHYVVFGPKVRPPEEVAEYVRRFGVFSRLAHFTLLLSFLVLAATGICMVSGVNVLLSLRTRSVHGVFACVLLGAMLLACLGYKGRVPAGRPSAGQRILFWLPVLVVVSLAVTGGMLMFEAPSHWLPLAYTVHKTCGYLMILAVLGYVYLDSVAKPGTLGVPFRGKVIEAWLTRHHADYAEKVLQDDEKQA